jgi:hypothetical protein
MSDFIYLYLTLNGLSKNCIACAQKLVKRHEQNGKNVSSYVLPIS